MSYPIDLKLRFFSGLFQYSLVNFWVSYPLDDAPLLKIWQVSVFSGEFLGELPVLRDTPANLAARFSILW
ncbi:MAG: hypothetical protein KC449_26560 [Anaerolineales bacterium]|nr:hypothetical protein [Anaerolineales bacterium]